MVPDYRKIADVFWCDLTSLTTMKIQLQRDKSAYLRVSPDLKVVSLFRTHDNGSEAHMRDLDEFETNFVTSTIIALTSQMQDKSSLRNDSHAKNL